MFGPIGSDVVGELAPYFNIFRVFELGFPDYHMPASLIIGNWAMEIDRRGKQALDFKVSRGRKMRVSKPVQQIANGRAPYSVARLPIPTNSANRNEGVRERLWRSHRIR